MLPVAPRPARAARGDHVGLGGLGPTRRDHPSAVRSPAMDLSSALLLVAAGVGAGTVNAVAGGGSLITFPALVAVGLPPVAANVTNSIAISPGYLASVAGSHRDLADERRPTLRLIPTVIAGTGIGCALLLLTPAEAFEQVVPFLVIGAAILLALQEKIKSRIGHPHQL